MDTVVKSLMEEAEEEEQKKGFVIFGRDITKVPCFRNSFLYGIMSGVGVGLATFLKTSKPLVSQHVGMASFTLTTLVYWSICRYQWSKDKFDAELMQEALRNKILHEGTSVEREIEGSGVLKSA